MNQRLQTGRLPADENIDEFDASQSLADVLRARTELNDYSSACLDSCAEANEPK